MRKEEKHMNTNKKWQENTEFFLQLKVIQKPKKLHHNKLYMNQLIISWLKNRLINKTQMLSKSNKIQLTLMKMMQNSTNICTVKEYKHKWNKLPCNSLTNQLDGKANLHTVKREDILKEEWKQYSMGIKLKTLLKDFCILWIWIHQVL